MSRHYPCDLRGSRHGWALGFTLVAAFQVPTVAAVLGLGDDEGGSAAGRWKDVAAIQQKWSLSDAVSNVGDEIGSTVHKVENVAKVAAKDVGKTTGKLAEEARDAAESVGGAIGNLADEGERAAVQAAMSASGLCPKILKASPDMVQDFSARSAKALQTGEEDPSTSQAVCRAQVSNAVASIINKNLEGRPDVLKKAAAWAVSDAITKTCEELKETLSSASGIRQTDPDRYETTVRHKLLECLPDIARSEIGLVCPDGQSKRLRLFADEQEGVAAAPRQPFAAVPRLLPAAAALASAGLLAAVTGRRLAQCRASPLGLPAGGLADDVGCAE